MDCYRLAASLLSISSILVMAALPAAVGGGGGDADSMQCIQKLVPCQPYLQSPSPPIACCAPLKQIVEDDATCLCAVFSNPEILGKLNLTKENALDLPKACGANADISICKNSANPPTASPATPSSPSASTNDTSSSDSSNSTNSSTTNSKATKIAGLIGLSFVSASMASIFISLF